MKRSRGVVQQNLRRGGADPLFRAMTTQSFGRAGHGIAAIVVASTVTSCAAFSALSEAHSIANNTPLRPGDLVVAAEDSELRAVQGTTLDKGNYRQDLRGRTGMVVPAGAVLEVTPYVTTAGPEAVSPHAIWIYTKVTSSPIAAQANRAGWIHRDTVKLQKDLGGPAPRGAKMDRATAKPSFLCSRPGESFANIGCVSISAHTPMHVIGCEGGSAQVELWTTEGFYTNGFVKTSQFEHDPCVR